MAHIKRKTYENAKTKYYSLAENLTELRNHVENEADHWPIYARPVIFTSFDHEAQVEFAKAQHFLRDAEETIPEIDTISIPDYSRKFDLGNFFNVDKHIKTIQAGNRIAGIVSFLDESIGGLEDAIKTIRVDWHKVEKARRNIRRSINVLKGRLEHTSEKLTSTADLGAHTVNQVSWALQAANNSYLSALEQVKKEPDEEQGYLEHAIADTFVEIGNFALDCIDVYIEMELVSKNYDLDTFTSLFRRSTDFLISILEISDLRGWRKLHRAKNYINQFPDIKQKAVASLHDFKRQRNLFETRKSYFSGLSLQDMINEANLLQEQCSFYWYSFEERKDTWQAIIRNDPLPSVALTQIESEFISNILPFTGHDVIVKQSSLPNLIGLMQNVLDRLRETQRNIRNLALELDRHKKAQDAVEKMLSSEGKTYLTIIKLDNILKDTAPQITDVGRQYIPIYQGFIKRAEAVKGANYPALEQELNAFTESCLVLIEDHIKFLADLKSKYEALRNIINKSLEEFELYLHMTPAFDAQSVRAFSLFYDSGWNILQQNTGGKYSELISRIGEMEKWRQGSESYLSRARQKYDAFIGLCQQVKKQIEMAQEQVLIQRNIASRKWGWARQEITRAVDQTEGDLDVQVKNWQRHDGRGWVELYIHQAIKHCESFLGEVDELLNELNTEIRKINYEQEKINNRVRDVKSIIFNNQNKLSAEEIGQAKALMAIAARAEDKDVAEKILSYAEKIVLRQASRREKADARKIIVINSGGGAGILGDVNTRGGGFAGRDDNSIRVSRRKQ